MAQYDAADIIYQLSRAIDKDETGVFVHVEDDNGKNEMTIVTNGGQKWQVMVAAVGGKIPSRDQEAYDALATGSRFNMTAVRPEGERIRPLQPHADGLYPSLLNYVGKTRTLAEDVAGTVSGRMVGPYHPAMRQQIPNPKKRLIGVDEKDYINGGL